MQISRSTTFPRCSIRLNSLTCSRNQFVWSFVTDPYESSHQKMGTLMVIPLHQHHHQSKAAWAIDTRQDGSKPSVHTRLGPGPVSHPTRRIAGSLGDCFHILLFLAVGAAPGVVLCFKVKFVVCSEALSYISWLWLRYWFAFLKAVLIILLLLWPDISKTCSVRELLLYGWRLRENQIRRF